MDKSNFVNWNFQFQKYCLIWINENFLFVEETSCPKLCVAYFRNFIIRSHLQSFMLIFFMFYHLIIQGAYFIFILLCCSDYLIICSSYCSLFFKRTIYAFSRPFQSISGHYSALNFSSGLFKALQDSFWYIG